MIGRDPAFWWAKTLSYLNYAYSEIVAHNDDAEAEWHVNKKGLVLSRYVKIKTIHL